MKKKARMKKISKKERMLTIATALTGSEKYKRQRKKAPNLCIFCKLRKRPISEKKFGVTNKYFESILKYM